MNQDLLRQFDKSLFELPHISFNLFQYLRRHGARTIADAYLAIGRQDIHPALERELLAVFEIEKAEFDAKLPARTAHAKTEAQNEAKPDRSSAHEIARTIRLVDLDLPKIFMMWIESFGLETLEDLYNSTIPKRALRGEFAATANQLFKKYGLPERTFGVAAANTHPKR